MKYLCVVSKQLNYIISAFFLIITFTGLFLFIQKIPLDRKQKEIVIIDDFPGESSSPAVQKGRAIFNSKCASCHIMFKDATGPDLSAAIDGEQWSDRKKLYAWIRNPAAFMKNDAYTQNLKKLYKAGMTAFPDLTDEEIDAIVEYVRSRKKVEVVAMPMALR